MSSYHKEEVIKKINPKDNPHTNELKLEEIGIALSASSIPGIAATGAGVSSGSTDIHNKILLNTTAKTASKSATESMNSANKDACKVTNAAAVIVMQLMPGDPAGWRAIGFETTLEMVSDTVIPGQVIHCSVSQGDTLGTADIHHDPLANADDYRVYASKGLVTDRTTYIDVTNYEESTSKSSTTITLPSDYLNVPLNFIIVAHNTAGDGPDSTPFGGGRRIQ